MLLLIHLMFHNYLYFSILFSELTHTKTLSHEKSPYIKSLISIYGVSGAIRTRDRTLRRRMLYPAELRGHISNEQINSIIFFNINQVLKSLKKKKLLILTVLTIYSL